MQWSSTKGSTAMGLIAELDSVLLGVYQVFDHEKATLSITQIIETGDAYHENYYVIVPSSKVVVHSQFITENSSVVPLVDNSVTINQRYIYGLKDSTVSYKICLGNATKASVSTLYGFANEETYKKYIQSFSKVSASESIFTKDFLIGGHGEIICGNFSYSFSDNGYYFFVLKTRYANTYANYTVSADLNQLSISDYLKNYSACRVDQYDTSCSLKLDSPDGEWSLIGYSAKNYDLSSHLNHVQISTSREGKSPWSTSTSYSEVLLCGGIGIVFGGLLYLLVLIAARFFISPQRRNNVYSTI